MYIREAKGLQTGRFGIGAGALNLPKSPVKQLSFADGPEFPALAQCQQESAFPRCGAPSRLRKHPARPALVVPGSRSDAQLALLGQLRPHFLLASAPCVRLVSRGHRHRSHQSYVEFAASRLARCGSRPVSSLKRHEAVYAAMLSFRTSTEACTVQVFRHNAVHLKVDTEGTLQRRKPMQKLEGASNVGVPLLCH
eukprot:CAMPEP_0170600110 /NCGR_PEP_ID=MMETSP0224-20130122/17163_1 /TAXON_ID=285029 /ORGANISM="Togula jolla, Strain CCCM 725" /LENGTH=194 /DNA_ID=CAMNT_0010924821 /DNA_START=287 /DNA_END=872 /DNA_ORIENTATION=+